MMSTDIMTRADIDELMQRFYGAAMADPVIGYIFTEVAHLDLREHLPIIGDFWESVLFGSDTYRQHGNNPLDVHEALNLREPLLEHHFERWLELFGQSVDSLFHGPRAEYAKQRAAGIARRMLARLSHQAAAASGSLTPL